MTSPSQSPPPARVLGRSPGGVGAPEPARPSEPGWLRAERAETIRARPAECVAAIVAFEGYPDWQAHITAVEVLERDKRGRGVRVACRAAVGQRVVAFTLVYRFPSPNQVHFEQVDGELEAVRGAWRFRAVRGGRTRAVFALEVKPGWPLGLMLRGPLIEQVGNVVLDHLMAELRRRVEPGAPGPEPGE